MKARVSSFPKGESAKAKAAGEMESVFTAEIHGQRGTSSSQVVSRVSLATIPDEILEALDKQTNDFKKAEKGTSLGHTTTYFFSRLEQ